MEKYLIIITTMLVVTQIIRLIQNTISLHRQRKAFKSGMDGLLDITNEDMLMKREHDRLAVEWYTKAIGK